MKARLTLKPGQRGTKGLVEEYGDALFCVRYRYDEERRKRVKTVELIVEEVDWTPPRKYAANAIVPVRIASKESALKEKVKAFGGKWNPGKKVWFVRYGKIAVTPLEKHIIVDALPADRKKAKASGSKDKKGI